MLVFISVMIGLIIIFVQTELVSLKDALSLKLLYSALAICLLLSVITFSAKLFSTDAGKKWLDSFSDNGDCEKPNRPYWCEL
jgi:hypothetical protein